MKVIDYSIHYYIQWCYCHFSIIKNNLYLRLIFDILFLFFFSCLFRFEIIFTILFISLMKRLRWLPRLFRYTAVIVITVLRSNDFAFSSRITVVMCDVCSSSGSSSINAQLSIHKVRGGPTDRLHASSAHQVQHDIAIHGLYQFHEDA